MNYISIFNLLITIVFVINAVASSTVHSKSDCTICPEEYQELTRRNNLDWQDEDNYNDNDDQDESLETVCEQAMGIIVKHHNIAKVDSTLLLSYCPHYGDRLAMEKANFNALYENKKHESKLKRHELNKRFALRFIRKRVVRNL